MIGSRYRDTVIINTKDGDSIKGVFWGARGGTIRLRDATLLQNGQTVPVDGEAIVFKSNVSFLQRIVRVE